MEKLVIVLLIIVAMQAIAIMGFIAIIKELRQSKKNSKKTARGIIRGMVRQHSIERSERNKLQNDYDELYSAYQEVFIRLGELNKRHKELKAVFKSTEDAHHYVCGNLADLIRNGQIIKSKFKDQVFTYKLEDMTKGELTELFGDRVIS